MSMGGRPTADRRRRDPTSDTIPAKAEYITLGRLALAGRPACGTLPDETLGDLKLALTEACSNSVRHAYRDGRRGHVEIRYELHGDRLVIEVCDDGDGFDSPWPPSRRGGPQEGGLGIAIIRALADEFELARGTSVSGSRLRFVKFLGSPELRLGPLAVARHRGACPGPTYAPARQRRPQVARRLRDDRLARADGRDPRDSRSRSAGKRVAHLSATAFGGGRRGDQLHAGAR